MAEDSESDRKELKRITDSKRFGAGADKVYTPKSWTFKALQFLQKTEKPVHVLSVMVLALFVGLCALYYSKLLSPEPCDAHLIRCSRFVPISTEASIPSPEYVYVSQSKDQSSSHTKYSR